MRGGGKSLEEEAKVDFVRARLSATELVTRAASRQCREPSAEGAPIKLRASRPAGRANRRHTMAAR